MRIKNKETLYKRGKERNKPKTFDEYDEKRIKKTEKLRKITNLINILFRLVESFSELFET